MPISKLLCGHTRGAHIWLVPVSAILFSACGRPVGADDTCPEGGYVEDGDPGDVCVPWTDCDDDQYVRKEPTSTSDRLCAPCPPFTHSLGPNAEGCVPELPELVSLVAGAYHTCGIRVRDGQAQCWGADGFGAARPPLGVRFTSLAAGDVHTCGIRESDGQAQCWGDNRLDRAAPPSGVAFASLAAGLWHTCGIRASDGEAQCWGLDRFGQATPPSGVSFTSLVAGTEHACGVRVGDGQAQCWGNNRVSVHAAARI